METEKDDQIQIWGILWKEYFIDVVMEMHKPLASGLLEFVHHVNNNSYKLLDY